MFALIERDLSAIVKLVPRLNPIPKDDGVNPYWVSLYEIIDNQSTGQYTVLENYVQTIYSNKVERVRIKRDMTAQEMEELDDQLATDSLNDRGILKALAKALYTLVNQVRALNSQPEITPEQFKDYIKNLIN